MSDRNSADAFRIEERPDDEFGRAPSTCAELLVVFLNHGLTPSAAAGPLHCLNTEAGQRVEVIWIELVLVKAVIRSPFTPLAKETWSQHPRNCHDSDGNARQGVARSAWLWLVRATPGRRHWLSTACLSLPLAARGAPPAVGRWQRAGPEPADGLRNGSDLRTRGAIRTRPSARSDRELGARISGNCDAVRLSQVLF